MEYQTLSHEEAAKRRVRGPKSGDDAWNGVAEAVRSGQVVLLPRRDTSSPAALRELARRAMKRRGLSVHVYQDSETGGIIVQAAEEGKTAERQSARRSKAATASTA